jgi:hypothetical protein
VIEEGRRERKKRRTREAIVAARARGTTPLDALRAQYRALERGLGARGSISGGSIERPYEPRPLDR